MEPYTSEILFFLHHIASPVGRGKSCLLSPLPLHHLEKPKAVGRRGLAMESEGAASPPLGSGFSPWPLGV